MTHLRPLAQVVFLAHDYFPSIAGKEGGFDRPLVSLPYCEGDYWPGQAETYCAQYRDGSLVLAPEKVTNAHMVSTATSKGPPLSPSPNGESGEAAGEAGGLVYPIGPFQPPLCR